MYWKKYSNLPQTEKQDEVYFILGIDLGNNSSIISFYDKKNREPEIIDMSGGYGKPSFPTIVQYMPETREWVYGEYAILNKGVGKDITVSALLERLGKREYVEIQSKSMSIASVLGLFLKELIGNVKNINPKAEMVGIVVSAPSYLSEEAKEELVLAFHIAGYAKELIELTEDKICALNRYTMNRPVQAEKIMLLDFGSRELRGGVYDIHPDAGGQSAHVRCLSSLFEPAMGSEKMNGIVYDLFSRYYCQQFHVSRNKISPAVKSQLDAFVYQHKDLLFQKNIAAKPIRLYFNFAYPPFQKNVSKDDVESGIFAFKREFERFIDRVLSKNIYDDKSGIARDQINAVICLGGGFEMLWARELVERIFAGSRVVFYKNSKGVLAEGAAVIAAGKLGVAKEKSFVIEDFNQLTVDIGVQVVELEGTKGFKREKFVPIVERNSFWWQKHSPKYLIVNEKTDKPVTIGLYKRMGNGDTEHLRDVVLNGLPLRPRGTTRLRIDCKLENYNQAVATVSDIGFGDLFPKSEFREDFLFNV